MKSCKAPMRAMSSATAFISPTLVVALLLAAPTSVAMDEAAGNMLDEIEKLIAAHGCRSAYIDVGTNVGMQVRKVYEPGLYAQDGRRLRADARAAARDGYLELFDAAFGEARSRSCNVCVIGMEPNPRHRPHLVALQGALRDAGAGVLVLPAAASTISGANLTFHTQAQAGGSRAAALEDQGATASPLWKGLHARNVPATMLKRTVSVPTVDLAEVILRTRRALARNGNRQLTRIVMKLDVETSEYHLLPHLILSQALCTVDDVVIEFHGKLLTPSVAEAAAAANHLSDGETGAGLITDYIHSVERWLVEALEKPRADCRAKLHRLSGSSSGENARTFSPFPQPGALRCAAHS